MKFKAIFFLLVIVVMVSCKQTEARRPKKQGTENFYKEVIEKNKKLNALEKKYLENWISKDTITKYETSPLGFWYAYKNKDSVNSVTPVLEDLVLISYDVTDLNGNTIYEKQEKSYKVDKEDFIPALQEGIKLMKKGETITFVIPSYSAFGVTGDGNKIAVNQPIISTVTLIEIKSNK